MLTVATGVLALTLLSGAASGGVGSPALSSGSGMYTLTVSFQGQGRGFVGSSANAPQAISCATTCSVQLPDDIGPVLGASVAVGSSFGGFSSNCLPQEHSSTSCQLFHYAGEGDQTVEVTFNVKPPPCIAPAVEGGTVARARTRIEQSHCVIGSVKHVVSSLVKKGRVISQSPPGKWQNKPGSPVDLVVSKGKPPLRTDDAAGPLTVPFVPAIAPGEPATASAPVTLTVSRIGDGDGWVTSDPAGISCGTICSAQFPSGTDVTLTAQTAYGFGPGFGSTVWAGWTNESGAKCLSRLGPPPPLGTSRCQVSLNSSSADTTVGATFHGVAVCIPTTDLRGKTLASAKSFLGSENCSPGKIRRAFSNKPKGRVISQNPPLGWRRVGGGAVNLVVSKGKR